MTRAAPSSPGQQALRKGRFSGTGHIYHVTTTTFQRRPVFTDLWPARCLVAEMRALQTEEWLDTQAWVIMPDHLHWLFQLGSSDLPRVMQRFKSRSAIAVNRLLGSRDRLWQPGYHDHALRKDEDIRHVARYIVANPLRAGLVARLADYPHWDATWL